jgi:Protein of unknown function (DUF742)
MSEHAAGDGQTWPWSGGDANDHGPVEEPQAGGVSRLRPYVVTSGRVSPLDENVEIEAQVATTEFGVESKARVAFERREILQLCRTTMSVAEVAARLGLHIGVARVLVSELAASGYLTIRRPSPQNIDDVDLIERVIRGLQGIH